MTPDRLLRFFDAWNAHDVDTIVSFFTPDGAYFASIGADDDGTAFRGLKEVRRGVAAFLGTYGDVRYTELQFVVSGDRGFASWTFSGTDGAGEAMSYRGVDLFEFEGDLISLKDAFRKERAAPIGS